MQVKNIVRWLVRFTTERLVRFTEKGFGGQEKTGGGLGRQGRASLSSSLNSGVERVCRQTLPIVRKYLAYIVMCTFPA